MKRAVSCCMTMDLAVREEISRELAMGRDPAQIARQVGFAPSSPANGARVPSITRKPLASIAHFVE
ncbi:MAG: hypothetical protein ACKO15_00315 [Burkholderiales bacterium]